MLQRWTSIADSYLSAEKSIDLDEIDQNFLHELRDLRTISIEKEFQDMQKSLVMSRLEQFNSTLHFLKSVEMNFRMISRNMFSLGAGLTQSKDFRDFFNDCVEKLIEPIKQLDWSSRELDNFLTAMVNSWKDIKENEHTRRFDAVYIRYMEVMKKCMLQMYK